MSKVFAASLKKNTWNTFEYVATQNAADDAAASLSFLHNHVSQCSTRNWTRMKFLQFVLMELLYESYFNQMCPTVSMFDLNSSLHLENTLVSGRCEQLVLLKKC